MALSFVAISEKIKRNPDDNIFIAARLPLKLGANHTFNKIFCCVFVYSVVSDFDQLIFYFIFCCLYSGDSRQVLSLFYFFGCI